MEKIKIAKKKTFNQNINGFLQRKLSLRKQQYQMEAKNAMVSVNIA